MFTRLKFKPHSQGLESILGELERPIMEVLWKQGEASVTEVEAQLQGASAYTTLKTVMERLERKGYLSRVKEGRAFRYRATLSREQLEGRASRGVIEGLLDAFGSTALTQFADVVLENPQRLEQLRKMLEALPETNQTETNQTETNQTDLTAENSK